jgi:hypothetical protein
MKIDGEPDRDLGNLRIAGRQRPIGDTFEGSSENQVNIPGNNPCPLNGRLNVQSTEAFELERVGESGIPQNQANPLAIQSVELNFSDTSHTSKERRRKEN